MLVILPRGVNFGFWYHLGCSGHNAIICSHKGLVGVAHEETFYMYIVNSFYLFHSFNQIFL